MRGRLRDLASLYGKFSRLSQMQLNFFADTVTQRWLIAKLASPHSSSSSSSLQYAEDMIWKEGEREKALLSMKKQETHRRRTLLLQMHNRDCKCTTLLQMQNQICKCTFVPLHHCKVNSLLIPHLPRDEFLGMARLSSH